MFVCVCEYGMLTMYVVWRYVFTWHLTRQVWNIVITQLTQATLALVFQVSECIELNMVDEKVVTLGFNKETLKPYPTSSIQ
jgi:hypothetical protein